MRKVVAIFVLALFVCPMVFSETVFFDRNRLLVDPLSEETNYELERLKRTDKTIAILLNLFTINGVGSFVIGDKKSGTKLLIGSILYSVAIGAGYVLIVSGQSDAAVSLGVGLLAGGAVGSIGNMILGIIYPIRYVDNKEY